LTEPAPRHIVYQYPYCYSICLEGDVERGGLGTWLRRLRAGAQFVSIAALCLAVAMLVISLIPRSPVTVALPSDMLTGLDAMRGVVSGVIADPDGSVVVAIAHPSLAQRLLNLATIMPGLLLVAEIARRMAKLLRAAQDSDPFTASTVRELTVVAKITAFGGLGVWAVAIVAAWVLSATVLTSGAAVEPDQSLLGWAAVGLIFAAFAQLIARGVAMRTELDTVI
jgi:hypothetical protein